MWLFVPLLNREYLSKDGSTAHCFRSKKFVRPEAASALIKIDNKCREYGIQT